MLSIIDDVLTSEEITQLIATFNAVGFTSGSKTAKGVAAKVKHNLQLPLEDQRTHGAQQLVLDALKRSQKFFFAAFPRRAFPPLFNCYEIGMSYGPHVDNAVLLSPSPLRGDLAATLFLSDPDSYDGGELVLDSGAREERIKLAAGSMVVYPPYYVHRVEAVTRGRRLAAITWVESMLRDPRQRAVLAELERTGRAIDQVPQVKHADRTALTNVYHTLMRMWLEP